MTKTSTYKRIIIETVGKCNLTCTMCPTAHYGSKFKGIMDDELFERCITFVKKDMEVILTGWGEPLLDKKLDIRIKKVKEKQAIAYMATNATLLDSEQVKKIVVSGIDGLSISLDAGTKDVYKTIRKGDFGKVINNIKRLCDEREKNNPNLWVDMSFVSMKSNIKDMKNFLALASNLGVNSVSITPKYLSFSQRDYQDNYVEPPIVLEELNRAKNTLNLQDIEIRTYALEHFLKDDCLAQATSTVFISYKGEVSACCNLGHPAPRYIPSIDECIMPFTIYGNIIAEPLDNIWKSNSYKCLRDELSKGNVPRPCSGCFLAPR